MPLRDRPGMMTCIAGDDDLADSRIDPPPGNPMVTSAISIGRGLSTGTIPRELLDSFLTPDPPIRSVVRLYAGGPIESEGDRLGVESDP